MKEIKGFKFPTITEEELENLPEELKKIIKFPIENLTTHKTTMVNSSNRQLNILKNRLSSTDYKIIKCYEYSLAGLDIPYDIISLHQEREELRNQIRELEKGE
jgi:hypothetical protein